MMEIKRMSSLPKQRPTIFNYIEGWVGDLCPCGNEIDVTLLPDTLDPDRDRDVLSVFATLCPECVIGRISESQRENLERQYQRLRRDRLSVGLGSVNPHSRIGLVEPDHSARRSLRWHAGPLTLSSRTWRGPASGKPTGMVMEQLTITGVAAEYLRSQLDSDTIGPLPWFEVGDPDPRVEVLPATPVIVMLGTNISDPKQPGLEWRERWNFHSPDRRGFSGISPSRQAYEYSPRERREFADRAQKLFETQNQGGRRRKTSVPQLQELVQQYRKDNNGEDPTKEDLAELARVDPDTILNTLQREDYETYRDFLLGVPSRQRMARTIRT
jgi:hypothetical protein